MANVPFTISADIQLSSRVAPYMAETGYDVKISEGLVPESLQDANSAGAAVQYNDHQMIVSIPNGVRFLIGGGDHIIYERGGASDREVCLFLLGSAWGALCYQRGLLPLHASAVIKDGNIHAFTGPSGAGKSTLSAALAKRGHYFFTDDILIIDTDKLDQEAFCYVGQKDLKLWQDALALVDATKLSMVRDDDSFKKYFAAPKNRTDVTAGILANLIILKSGPARRESDPFVIEPLTGAQAIKQLRDSVYRPNFAYSLWGLPKLYKALAALNDKIDILTFDRTLERDCFNDSANFIDQWVNDWHGDEQ